MNARQESWDREEMREWKPSSKNPVEARLFDRNSLFELRQFAHDMRIFQLLICVMIMFAHTRNFASLTPQCHLSSVLAAAFRAIISFDHKL
ncbi:hypothetical protein KIN20_002649 [Parelaphostrongylus tenuis]|uniref:Uncharacterized protein n=1 Tax=Parelaphostrongylus tenuis TaxID=148309 RepID=A0AAD5QDP0_PARTN|nr:hypothetical protein KIN20_002649 [Parelaphostrongylus tenuis]